MKITFTSTAKSGYSNRAIGEWLALTFTEAGIWDLNDVYAWQTGGHLDEYFR